MKRIILVATAIALAGSAVAQAQYIGGMNRFRANAYTPWAYTNLGESAAQTQVQSEPKSECQSGDCVQSKGCNASCCQPKCGSCCGGSSALWWPVSPGCCRPLFGKFHGGCGSTKGCGAEACGDGCKTQAPCQTGCGKSACGKSAGCGSSCCGTGALTWPVTPCCGYGCGGHVGCATGRHCGKSGKGYSYGYGGSDCCTPATDQAVPDSPVPPAPVPVPDQPTNYRLQTPPPAPGDHSASRDTLAWPGNWR